MPGTYRPRLHRPSVPCSVPSVGGLRHAQRRRPPGRRSANGLGMGEVDAVRRRRRSTTSSPAGPRGRERPRASPGGAAATRSPWPATTGTGKASRVVRAARAAAGSSGARRRAPAPRLAAGPRVRSRQRLPALVADHPAHEALGRVGRRRLTRPAPRRPRCASATTAATPSAPRRRRPPAPARGGARRRPGPPHRRGCGRTRTDGSLADHRRRGRPPGRRRSAHGPGVERLPVAAPVVADHGAGRRGARIDAEERGAPVERAVHQHDPRRARPARAAPPRRGRPRRRTLERWTHGAAPHPPRAPRPHRRGVRRRARPTRRSSDLGHAQAAALAEWLARGARRRALVQPDAPRPRDGRARWPSGSGSTCGVDDGLAEFDREALSYIPIEELKAAGDPRWNEVPEQPEHFRAGRGRRRRAASSPPTPASASRSCATAASSTPTPPTSSASTTRCSSSRPTPASAACSPPAPASAASPASTRPPTSAASEPRTRRGVGPPEPTPRAAPHGLAQLRGTCAQGTSLSTRTSPGRPSTRSPRMFLAISVVPPSIELARARRNACCGLAHVHGVLRALHRVAVGLEHPLGAEQVDGEGADVLVEVGRQALPIEPSGPGVADGAQLAGPDVGEPQHLGRASRAPSARPCGRGRRRPAPSTPSRPRR